MKPSSAMPKAGKSKATKKKPKADDALETLLETEEKAGKAKKGAAAAAEPAAAAVAAATSLESDDPEVAAAAEAAGRLTKHELKVFIRGSGGKPPRLKANKQEYLDKAVATIEAAEGLSWPDATAALEAVLAERKAAAQQAQALRQAKAILSGAKFSEFLQKRA